MTSENHEGALNGSLTSFVDGNVCFRPPIFRGNGAIEEGGRRTDLPNSGLGRTSSAAIGLNKKGIWAKNDTFLPSKKNVGKFALGNSKKLRRLKNGVRDSFRF